MANTTLKPVFKDAIVKPSSGSSDLEINGSGPVYVGGDLEINGQKPVIGLGDSDLFSYLKSLE